LGEAPTIVLCDDDEDHVCELAEYFERMGWIAKPFSRGTEAIAMIRSMGQVDCVLTDLNMPCMNGTALLAELRQLPESLRPRITGLMSAQMPREQPHLDALADFTVEKPVFPAAIIQWITDTYGISAALP